MRLFLQLGAGLVVALISTILIIRFQLQQQPVLLGGLLVVVCCAATLLGLLFRSGRSDGEAEPADGDREHGEVKWFNVSKGFGFIRRDNGEEIFVHFRSLRGPNRDRRQLKEGQRVSFVVADSEKGPQAEEVEPLGDHRPG